MKTSVLIPAVALAAIATPASAAILFGVDTTNHLNSFDSRAPGATLSRVLITGIDDNTTLRALDFRPATGQLFGFGGDKRVYSIDTITGVATALSAGPLDVVGTEFAFDFNPTIDRIRLVSNTGQNYVLNPNDGSLQLTATNVAYVPGDANAGRSPVITAAAYTPSAQTGNTADSQLFVIDSSTTQDVLVRMANNTGELRTVGLTGVDFGPRDSFDIAPDGSAFAIDENRLYSVNLQSGAFTFIGNTERSLFGLSAATPAIPEPATWAMMIGGFGAVGVAMRRRRQTITVSA